MKLIFEVHCRSIELNNERDVQSKRTRQYVNARIWSEKKKQSWKEKKDQGREESPSYDQHVKPRKKMESSSENNHQSSSLVSQSSFEKHAQGAYSLIGSFQSPSTCRLKIGGISSIFTANEANDGSVILWEKQIPCSQPMQKVSLFCVQMAKTDVKMRNSLGQPRSFIMGHLIGQL